jgi:hypothetical protein
MHLIQFLHLKYLISCCKVPAECTISGNAFQYESKSDNWILKPSLYNFFYFILFICAYNVWVISPLLPLPSPLAPLTPLYQAETILPLPLILLKREYKQ